MIVSSPAILTMGKASTLLLIAAGWMMAACAGNTGEQYLTAGLSQGKKIFRYNQAEGLSSLDPAFARNQANVWAANQLYNGLFELDANLRVIPALAESWSLSPDGRTYTIQLRKGVHFHDHKAFADGKGREVNAQDFVYTFRRIIDPRTRSTGAWIFTDKVLRTSRGRIDPRCFEAVGRHTLKIRLQKPFAPFLEILAMPYTYVIPQEAVAMYGHDFSSHPVGTGPFVFKSWEEGNDLVLVRNPHYWRRDEQNRQLPYLDGVQVSFIPDKKEAFRHFAQGKLSFLSGLEESAREEILNTDGSVKETIAHKFNVQKSTFLSTEYLGIQLDPAKYEQQNHPLLDKRVRQALNYAIDRQKMVAFLQNNLGQPGVEGLAPNALPAFDTTKVSGYDFNLEKARQLLAEAGYPEGKDFPELTLYINPPQKERCEYLRQQWAALGIEVTFEINPFTTHQEMVDNGQANFFRGLWTGDYPDAENYLSMFYSKHDLPYGPNKTNFQNADFDHLYEQAREETDLSRRYELYHQMEKIVLEEAPVIVLFYDEAVRLTQPNIEGVSANALNNLSLERVNIRPEAISINEAGVAGIKD